MDKQTRHNDIIAFLDSYLKEIPKEQILSEINEISQIEFVGTTAVDYFANIHNHFLPIEEQTPETQESIQNAA